MIGLYIALGLLAVLIITVLIRTFLFTPKPQPKCSDEEIEFNKKKAVEDLQELVRCKTVSYYDSSLEDDEEFSKLKSLLPKLYPNVFETCSYLELDDRGILFKWQGKKSDSPTVLMAHYDVVPVDEDKWEKAPFEAIIEDGVMWGRGTLDTKVTFSSILFSANELIKDGFVPENDMYFAFSGGEEVNGRGAANIVKWFEDNKITPALVLDEGGAVVENVFPGVDKPCGLIGLAEKGMMNVTFKVNSNGGHASAPKPHTPIGILSEVCSRIENNPFPMHLTPPAEKLFDTLGRHSSFVYRMIFANMWLFKGILNMICKKSGGELNALLRTTVAFTQASGSSAPNVIPPTATMTANIRLNPQDTVESAMERFRKLTKDKDCSIELGSHMNPSPISVTDDMYDRVASAVASTWKGCLVSPYLMVQCSDSRHYGRISDHVYRFSAMDLTKEERGTIHGNNERIRLEALYRATEFYIRLIKNS